MEDPRLFNGSKSSESPGIFDFYARDNFERPLIVTDFFDFFIPKPTSHIKIQRGDSFGHPSDSKSLRIGISKNIIKKLIFKNLFDYFLIKLSAAVSALKSIEFHLSFNGYGLKANVGCLRI